MSESEYLYEIVDNSIKDLEGHLKKFEEEIKN